MSTVVVSGSWSTALPSSTAKLKVKVAKLYGLDGDAEAEQTALDALDDSVKEMNLSLFDFMLVTQTGITIVADEDEYELAASFFKEKSAFLVNSDGVQRPPLVYLDYATYRRLWGDMTVSRIEPQVYSALNTHADGKIYLAPKPSSSNAADYTLSISFHRRIPLPSEVGTLNVPQEAESIILYGAYKRMSIDIQGAYHPDVSKFEELQEKWLEKLEAQDRRHPDEATRFRIVDKRLMSRSQRAGGTLYIKI